MQFIQGGSAALRPIVVRFIHDEHQIGQRRKVLIERIANDLIDFFHIGVFLVELVDVIYEDANVRFKGG